MVADLREMQENQRVSENRIDKCEFVEKNNDVYNEIIVTHMKKLWYNTFIFVGARIT